MKCVFIKCLRGYYTHILFVFLGIIEWSEYGWNLTLCISAGDWIRVNKRERRRKKVLSVFEKAKASLLLASLACCKPLWNFYATAVRQTKTILVLDHLTIDHGIDIKTKKGNFCYFFFQFFKRCDFLRRAKSKHKRIQTQFLFDT